MGILRTVYYAGNHKLSRVGMIGIVLVLEHTEPVMMHMEGTKPGEERRELVDKN
jgi:hypothetical protein